MKRILSTFAILAASLLAYTACDEVEIPAEITIPDAESLELFNTGITFSASKEGGVQTVTLSFVSSLSWSASIEETKAIDWLTIDPTSGAAGTAKITLTAKDNTETTPRSAKLTVSCGGFSKSVNVTQVGAEPEVEVSEIKLNKTELTLTKEESAKLVAMDAEGNVLKAAWGSNKPNVAVVDEEGNVKGVDLGEAIITAKVGEKSASCEVKVVDAIGVTSLSLTEHEVTIKEGETHQLVVILYPEGATTNDLRWVSAGTSIATVDEHGMVTAVKAGAAHITVGIGDRPSEGMYDRCLVTVVKADEVAVTSVTLDKTSLSLTQGETAVVTATVQPSNFNQTLNWKPKDPNVVSVTTIDATKAQFKAQTVGKTIVDVIAGGTVFATCEVTVSAKTVEVTSVTLDYTTLTMNEGQTQKLTATVNPADATDNTVTWSSSDESVATVKDGYVSAAKAGTATITAAAGGKSATCQVTVNAVEITSVAFNPSTLTLYTGKTQAVYVQYTPADATPDFTWTSSDPDVVSVEDASGAGFVSSSTKILKAKKAGTATITASTGGKSATLTVTVEDIKLARIELVNTTLTLRAGDTSRLQARCYNNDGSAANDVNIEWSSNNPSVATVEKMNANTGFITAIAAGTATITASVGDIKAECYLQVQ